MRVFGMLRYYSLNSIKYGCVSAKFDVQFLGSFYYKFEKSCECHCFSFINLGYGKLPKLSYQSVS